MKVCRPGPLALSRRTHLVVRKDAGDDDDDGQHDSEIEVVVRGLLVRGSLEGK